MVLTDLSFRLPTRTALETLTVLNQPIAPEWLKATLTSYLSMIPLRAGGVQETISFIASIYADANDATAVPREAIDHVSKLFATAPRFVSEGEFFSKLAPQLLDLLDGKGGPQLVHIAGIIIGQRILGKKSWGAPGSVGWKLFVEPIHKALDPSDDAEKVLTTEETLRVALSRLSNLVSAHPNPGLVGRLVGPVLVSLWGLCTYSASRPTDSFWSETSRQLLLVFFKLVANPIPFQTVAKNILFDGRSHWEFGPGSLGGIEIRQRKPTKDPLNLISMIADVEARTQTFTDIIKSSSVADKTIFEVLADLIKSWLASAHPKAERQSSRKLETDADPAHSLASAKLLEAMLSSFKEQIARQPLAVLFLVKQLLDDQIHSHKAAEHQRQSLKKPTVSNLGNIVRQSDSEVNGSTTEGQHETIAIALSLVGVTLSSDNTELSPEIRETLNAILTSVYHLPYSTYPPALQKSILATKSLIKSHFSSGRPATAPSTSSYAEDATTKRLRHDRALLQHTHADLSSDVPPIRAEALANLTKLIISTSPAIDVPTTTLLVLHSITADPESFVYLKAIQTLAVLAACADPRLVVRFALEAFVDEGEKEELDARLKVGEGVVGIVDALMNRGGDGSTATLAEKGVTAEALRRVAVAILGVASRRGKRPKQARQQEREQKKKTKRLLDEPNSLFNIVASEHQDPDDGRKSREQEAIAAIAGGWAATGKEEDIRIRTSALSILGKILSSAAGLAALTEHMLREAVEIALAVLALETAPEKAILRRAAALMFLEILKGLEEGLDSGTQIGTASRRSESNALDAQKWAEVERVLSWAKDVDEDEIVRGHTSAVLEILEAWRMKSLLAATRMDNEKEGVSLGRGTVGGGLELEGGLRGLAVNPDSNSRLRGRIEEIE